ncbi:hypothetical protein BDZ89DRAFT_1136938 [Hymenopellis radicata]|nr:hypothetical protein BDZ89DRAFT_1136938 [Hymenopellis radicata]
MPASAHDSSSTDDRSTTRDVSDDDFSDEDADADYQSCGSSMSDEDEARTAEDRVDGELEILAYMGDGKWEPIQVSDVQDRVGASMTRTEWISEIELDQRFDALMDSQERCLDATAVLAETERRDSRANYFFELQALLNLIMSSKGAWSYSYWWQFHILCMPTRGICHYSLTSSCFEGRMLLDYALDRPSKDFADVMRITLPYFREMNARIDALSKLWHVGYSSSSSDSASMFGPTNMANLITGLDIAESVAKLVPVFGAVLEGACGILRKTINAAEATRDECKALAEHTACITLAIINEIGSSSTEPAIPAANIFDLCVTIGEVERRITRLSTLSRLRYLTARGKINAEVKDLRARVDNARITFKIRSDISTTGLLYDLRRMQTRLESRVDELCEGQKTTHHMLRTILVEVEFLVSAVYHNVDDISAFPWLSSMTMSYLTSPRPPCFELGCLGHCQGAFGLVICFGFVLAVERKDDDIQALSCLGKFNAVPGIVGIAFVWETPMSSVSNAPSDVGIAIDPVNDLPKPQSATPSPSSTHTLTLFDSPQQPPHAEDDVAPQTSPSPQADKKILPSSSQAVPLALDDRPTPLDSSPSMSYDYVKTRTNGSPTILLHSPRS